jgi:GMP synthase-like glutamine amidotransferase
MKISILQNVSFEGPGMIKDWAEDKGHPIEIYKAYLNELPEEGSFDLLIILGGPMSANDTLPWLESEKEFIKKSINDGCMIMGICLGAQLIAKVLGASVTKNPDAEIGWFPIRCAVNFLSSELVVFHWHSETCSLPEGTQILASSIACKNQAFAYEDTVLGIQFHLEMDEKSLQNILLNCKSELVEGPYIQSEKEILSRKDLITRCREELYDLLDSFEMRCAT